MEFIQNFFELAQNLYSSRTENSKILHDRALSYLPSGVSASGKYVKPYPLFIKKAAGSKLWDVDDNEYVDYLLCYGAIILGHQYPKVVNAVKEQMEKGIVFGALSEHEIELAQRISECVPSAEKIRFANSGSEAISYAIRVARAFTRKDKIGKFEGNYHGNSDYGYVSVYPLPDRAGPESNPHPLPVGLGVPKDVLKTVMVLPFNNKEATLALIEKYADELAAVILEPMLGFGGGIAAEKAFLEAVRRVTKEYGIVLIFDEVVTGFRLGLGGGQEYFNVVPDMTVFGKIIGGGFPIGAYSGRNEIMEVVAPTNEFLSDFEAKVFQTGTFNGHPMAMAAGLATIQELQTKTNKIYPHINRLGSNLRRGWKDLFEDAGIAVQLLGHGSLGVLHFTSSREPFRNPRELFLKKSEIDNQRRKHFDMAMVGKGIFMYPFGSHSKVSFAHTDEDIQKTLDATTDIIELMKNET